MTDEGKDLTLDELTAIVREVTGGRPFRPFVAYHEQLDMTVVLWRDCSYYADLQRLDGVEVLRDNYAEGNPIVGVEIPGRLEIVTPADGDRPLPHRSGLVDSGARPEGVSPLIPTLFTRHPDDSYMPCSPDELRRYFAALSVGPREGNRSLEWRLLDAATQIEACAEGQHAGINAAIQEIRAVADLLAPAPPPATPREGA